MPSTWETWFLMAVTFAMLSERHGLAGAAGEEAERKHRHADYHDDGVFDEYAEPNYSYRYGVADRHTGDIKGAWEKRSGDSVWGAYWLRDADGAWRTVHYTADKSGFKAVVRRRPLVYTKGRKTSGSKAPGRQEEYPDPPWEEVVDALRKNNPSARDHAAPAAPAATAAPAKAAKDADDTLEKLLGPAWNEVDGASLGFDRPDWQEPQAKSAAPPAAEDMPDKSWAADADGKEVAWATGSDGAKVPIAVAEELKTEDVDSWIGPSGPSEPSGMAAENTKKSPSWTGRPVHVEEDLPRAPAVEGRVSILSSDEAAGSREPVHSELYDIIPVTADLSERTAEVRSAIFHKGAWFQHKEGRVDKKGTVSGRKGGDGAKKLHGTRTRQPSGDRVSAKGKQITWTKSKVQKGPGPRELKPDVEPPSDGFIRSDGQIKAAQAHTWSALPQAGAGARYRHVQATDTPKLSFSGWTPIEATRARPHADFEGRKRLSSSAEKKEIPDETSFSPKGKSYKHSAQDKDSKFGNKERKSARLESNPTGVLTVGSDKDHARANFYWHDNRWTWGEDFLSGKQGT